MRADIPKLMARNLTEVFNERDPDRRAAVMSAIYSSDIAFDEAERHCAARRRSGSTFRSCSIARPGPQFVAERAAVVVQDRGYLPWRLQPEGGDPPIVSGTAVAPVADSRIAEV